MATRSEKEKAKHVQEKCQAVLSQLLRDEDNKYCVDCDAKGPRWASWNLGIFLCIRCAGIHRNLGVHISKVKSVNLDTWTPEQVACLQHMGNSRARAVYEANLPDSFRRPHTDSSLEAFVRAKYEQKKYIAKEWVPSPVPKLMIEIEDDKKKQPEKKSRSKGSGVDIPVPSAIPAHKPSPPNISSPAQKPVLVPVLDKVTAANEKTSPKSKAAVDLLGLDDPVSPTSQSNDLFGNFLSAADTGIIQASPSHQSAAVTDLTDGTNTAKDDKSSEEESFFTQTNFEDSHSKQQMTKESILSLYAKSTPAPAQPPPPTFGVPGGMYVTPQAFQVQAMPVSYGGLPVVPTNVVQNGIMGSMPATNLMNGVQQAQVHQHGRIGATNVVGTNPFFSTGIPGFHTNQTPAGLGQLQQQMATMALGGGLVAQQPIGIVPTNTWAAQPPAGHTLSTNLWQ